MDEVGKRIMKRLSNIEGHIKNIRVIQDANARIDNGIASKKQKMDGDLLSVPLG